MASSKWLHLSVLLAVMSVNVCSPVACSDGLSAWLQYKRDFNKSYADPEEEAFRREVFIGELHRIESHNSDTSVSYRLGLNHMSDWTEHEFKRLLSARLEVPPAEEKHLRLGLDPYVAELLQEPGVPVPDEFDWRHQEWPKRIGSVKNQGDCGSCWAFATTALLESQEMNRLKMKQFVPLSEQHLLDCGRKADGCNGGLVTWALEDIAKWGGIMSEHDYPYKGTVQSQCLMNVRQLLARKVKGYAQLPPLEEEVMKKVLVRYGPIVVGVASCSWKAYSSGVLPASICDGPMDHAVLIVGYGRDCRSNLDYWIVQNSWGTDHGEGGYIKIERNSNACGIATIPLIARLMP